MRRYLRVCYHLKQWLKSNLSKVEKNVGIRCLLAKNERVFLLNFGAKTIGINFKLLDKTIIFKKQLVNGIQKEPEGV